MNHKVVDAVLRWLRSITRMDAPDHGSVMFELGRVVGECEASLDRTEVLRDDARRLDWYEANPAGLVCTNFYGNRDGGPEWQPAVFPLDPGRRTPSLRAAIDDAMQSIYE